MHADLRVREWKCWLHRSKISPVLQTTRHNNQFRSVAFHSGIVFPSRVSLRMWVFPGAHTSYRAMHVSHQWHTFPPAHISLRISGLEMSVSYRLQCNTYTVDLVYAHDPVPISHWNLHYRINNLNAENLDK